MQRARQGTSVREYLQEKPSCMCCLRECINAHASSLGSVLLMCVLCSSWVQQLACLCILLLMFCAVSRDLALHHQLRVMLGMLQLSAGMLFLLAITVGLACLAAAAIGVVFPMHGSPAFHAWLAPMLSAYIAAWSLVCVACHGQLMQLAG